MVQQDIENLISSATKPAFDFHDTANSGKFTLPNNAIIISGSYDQEGIEAYLKEVGVEGEIHINDGSNKTEDIAEFKVNKCKSET